HQEFFQFFLPDSLPQTLLFRIVLFATFSLILHRRSGLFQKRNKITRCKRLYQMMVITRRATSQQNLCASIAAHRNSENGTRSFDSFHKLPAIPIWKGDITDQYVAG